MPVVADDDVRGLVSLDDAIELVERAFVADALGRARTFPVVSEPLPSLDARFGIKSGCLEPVSGSDRQPDMHPDSDRTILGLKAGGYWARNRTRDGIPSHHSVILLFDSRTGMPRALVAANALTSLRTAAAGAVAARHLARPDAQKLTIIGAGDQARWQARGVLRVRGIDEVRIWARRTEAAERCAEDIESDGVRCIVCPDIREAVQGGDIVVTTTPAREPLVSVDGVALGAHITAVGSDGPGKQELDPELLRRGRVFVDMIKQSVTIGEVQHALDDDGTAADVVHGELGQVCAGLLPGRVHEEDITVFDCTGVSFQDLIVADYVVRAYEPRHDSVGGSRRSE